MANSKASSYITVMSQHMIHLVLMPPFILILYTVFFISSCGILESIKINESINSKWVNMIIYRTIVRKGAPAPLFKAPTP